jgi:Glycosyl hydrolase family 10
MENKHISLIVLSAALALNVLPLLSSENENIIREKPFSYTVFDFSEDEGWKLTAEGDKGISGLKGRSCILDFSKGAKSISVSPTPVSMLGRVTKITLKIRGTTGSHPVHFYIQTHFMTFHKVVGSFSASGDQVLEFDAPPGNGWLWKDGENDGEVHGPLRLLEIRFEGQDIRNECRIELVSMSIEGKIAENKLCVLTSECLATSDPVTFVAKVRSIGDRPLKGTLSWSVLSWDKKELETGSRRVTIAPAASENKFTIATGIKNPALRFAGATFHLDIPGQSVPDANACWLARNEAQNDTTIDTGTSFGMGAYLGRYHGRELEQMALKAKESGVKWIREDFDWGSMEPERGKFYWAFNDSVVKIAGKNGISVYAIVAYWPSWTKEYTKEGIDDYVTFLKELVKHYKKYIHQWEIWNEPNIFFWQGPQEMYAELLMKSYTAIKDVDSTAQVLGISTSGIDFDFIQRMQQLQAPFDILTIHPYRSKLDETAFIEELKRAAAMVVLPGGKRRPVWITEMGWTTYTPHNEWVQEGFLPTPLRVQAELIVRTYLSCIISGIDPKVFWYDLRNDGTDPLNFEDNIGIMNRDFSPKPAYIAYSTMTRTLKGMKFTKILGQPEGIFSGVFEDEKESNKKVIAIWSPSMDRNAEIEIDKGTATLINAIGEISQLKVYSADNRKFVNVQLKAGSPVYIKY